MSESVKEFAKEYAKEYVKKYKDERDVISVKKLMENLQLTLDQALNALDIQGTSRTYIIKQIQHNERVNKYLLGQKIILAYILVKTVDEFKGVDPRDAVELIEGEPYFDVALIEPGVEDKEIGEERMRFDIVFCVRMGDDLFQMTINIEAQKDELEKYDILNRAIFNVSRLISSEKEQEYRKQNTNDIKQIYSIWICTNMEENSMSYIHLIKEDLIGHYEWKGNLNLFHIIMIGVANELPEHSEMYELHRLLGVLLSQELTNNEKLDIVEKEYEIPMEKISGRN